MIVRYWGHKARIFTWMWVDPKGWSDRIGTASGDEYAFFGHAGQFVAPAWAITECEPEIRAAHHRIAAGEDLADLATHTLSPSASGTFLPKTAPDTVTEPENAQIGTFLHTTQEGLFT